MRYSRSDGGAIPALGVLSLRCGAPIRPHRTTRRSWFVLRRASGDALLTDSSSSPLPQSFLCELEAPRGQVGSRFRARVESNRRVGCPYLEPADPHVVPSCYSRSDTFIQREEGEECSERYQRSSRDQPKMQRRYISL